MTLSAGSRLGHYEIVARIGAGGMGEVYRARDSRLGREVAIKILPEPLASDAEGIARFEREARTVAGLNHPNIVVLHSVEQAAGIRFLTMELVEGQCLEQLVTPGGLPAPGVLDLAIPLADALAAAHDGGVVHRDLKPSNVMITREGRLKVLDFGLAKWILASPTMDSASMDTHSLPLSRAGQVLGTVHYMAPEQIRGEPVDARSDLFAFGIILFELLTGRRPFQGATFIEVGASILNDSPALGALRADVPGDLARIVARCLEKSPDRRVQTARDLKRELEVARRATQPAASSILQGGAPTAAGALDLPSIAVLPFSNRSNSEADEVFADGITEDVIAHLCKLRTLRVVSRRSVMAFKQRDESLQEIASKLQVATLLDGSIRRIADRVRIVVQLIDAPSEGNLWTETYDRELTDIFAIQTDVALQIATALKAELTPSERKRIRREPTRDVLAYELYQRGRHCFLRFTDEGISSAVEYYERAIERDPEFAMAHVGIAIACTELTELGALGRVEGRARAVPAAERAVMLDSDLGDANCALAYTRLVFEFDWARAEAGFKRAMELSPGSVEAYDLCGRMYAGMGRYDEAIMLHERAYAMDPLTCRADLANSYLRAGRDEDARRVVARAIVLEPHDARLRATLGWALLREGRVEDGLAELERAVSMNPNEDAWRAQLGQAYALAGRREEAREILRRLEDPSRPTRASLYHLAYVHTGLGDVQRAIECLERAFEDGVGPLYGMKGSFLLAPLREHPRFIALLGRMHLA